MIVRVTVPYRESADFTMFEPFPSFQGPDRMATLLHTLLAEATYDAAEFKRILDSKADINELDEVIIACTCNG